MQRESESDPFISWLKSAPNRLRGAARDGALALRLVPQKHLARARSWERIRALALKAWPRAIDAAGPFWRPYAERAISSAIAAFEQGGGW